MPKQAADLEFIFDENTPIGKYTCLFDVFFEGKKIEDTKIKLVIKIKEN